MGRGRRSAAVGDSADSFRRRQQRDRSPRPRIRSSAPGITPPPRAANRYIVVGVSIDRSGGNRSSTASAYGTEGGGTECPDDAPRRHQRGRPRCAPSCGASPHPPAGVHQITVSVSNAGRKRQRHRRRAVVQQRRSDRRRPGRSPAATANSATPSVAVTNHAVRLRRRRVGLQRQHRRWNRPVHGRTSATRIATVAAAPVTNFAGAGSGARGYANIDDVVDADGGAQTGRIEAIPLKRFRRARQDRIRGRHQARRHDHLHAAGDELQRGRRSTTSSSPMPSRPDATFVSQTGCAGAGPVTCNIGTLAAGATSAPITITVIANAAGTSRTSPRSPATATATTNSSETINTLAEAKICATPGKDGAGGTLGRHQERLLAGQRRRSPPARRRITVGARDRRRRRQHHHRRRSPHRHADAGRRLRHDERRNLRRRHRLDAGHRHRQRRRDDAQQRRTLGVRRRHEHASAQAGGALTFTGGGAGGGLLYSYTSQTFAATTTQGQRTFQVIRVPQYTTATLGSTLTALAWNGATGGVLAIDVSGTLALGSATVSVNGLGFRGGGGVSSTATRTRRACRHRFPDAARHAAPYATARRAKASPARRATSIRSARPSALPASGNAPLDTGVEGYVGGSYGRGAPGNAGGGSTDGDPTPPTATTAAAAAAATAATAARAATAGTCNCPSGGQGGGGISPNLTRITMGGGGGAGTTNNGSADRCCRRRAASTCRRLDRRRAGERLLQQRRERRRHIIIRALQATGTATLTANGFNAYNTGRDGSGGGGAGGSVLFTDADRRRSSGLTVQAKGGNGGNAWLTHRARRRPRRTPRPRRRRRRRIHPALQRRGVDRRLRRTSNGVTTTANDDYGAQPGTPGVVQTHHRQQRPSRRRRRRRARSPISPSRTSSALPPCRPATTSPSRRP